MIEIVNSDVEYINKMDNEIVSSREIINPSDYIESVRYLPPELTANPGYFEYSYTPYLKEIVDHLSPMSDTRKIAFMKPAQIGATAGILESAIAYYIGCHPTSIMYVSADKELVETGMEVKVDRMLDSCGLRDKISSQTNTANNKRTGDTKNKKEFPGGFLHAVGARNPGKLRQMSYQVILFDEMDGFPEKLGNEGSPVTLAENRTKAYANKKKILYLSTPTTLQQSKIYPLYLKGDQRNWNVTCPRCGKKIVMEWHIVNENDESFGLQYEVDEDGILIVDSVHYKCQECSGKIIEIEKPELLEGGEWMPTAKPRERGFVSYWMDAIYSPLGMYSWVDYVYSWLDCYDFERKKIKDMEKYKTFRNTNQGKTFEQRGESLSFERVISFRRYNYNKNEIINKNAIKETGSKILFITCAVDVQKESLIVDIKAWSHRGITYTLDFRDIKSKDPRDINDSAWRELENIIEHEKWVSDDSIEYQINATVIDSKWGESTETVYTFCRQYISGVYPIQGQSIKSGRGGFSYKGQVFKPFSEATIEKAGCLGYLINVDQLKDHVSRVLSSSWDEGELQSDWFPNFPSELRDDVFRQFTAEYKAKVVDKATGQFRGFQWKLLKGRDNHALDTFVYNRAILEIIASTECKQILGLKSINWSEWWAYRKTLVDNSK
jgi:phage terminase large subunit GpA-like protein